MNPLLKDMELLRVQAAASLGPRSQAMSRRVEGEGAWDLNVLPLSAYAIWGLGEGHSLVLSK